MPIARFLRALCLLIAAATVSATPVREIGEPYFESMMALGIAIGEVNAAHLQPS